jgi:alpha-mannosidase
MVRITLVRGATAPYAEADRGTHRLSYALLVHGGVSDLEQVHLAAERFNNPVAIIGDAAKKGEAGDTRYSFASADNDCVTIETVKAAEDGKGLILRIFEHANRRVSTRIGFGPKVKSVSKVNLMEEGSEPVDLVGNGVTLELRPFEITTLRVIPA